MALSVRDAFERALRLVNVQKFTANGTYTPTPGTTAIRATVVGSGGGGGSATTINGAAASGGASAEWAEIFYNPGRTFAGGAVVVGASAAGGVAGNPSSVVVDGLTFAAIGGTVGANNAAVASYGEADAPALGTSGNTANDLFRGSAASVGAKESSTTAGITAYTAGIGGSTPYGRGGRGSGGDANGGDASGFGSGGGGARRGGVANRIGGASGAGVIIIEEYQAA